MSTMIEKPVEVLTSDSFLTQAKKINNIVTSLKESIDVINALEDKGLDASNLKAELDKIVYPLTTKTFTSWVTYTNSNLSQIIEMIENGELGGGGSTGGTQVIIKSNRKVITSPVSQVLIDIVGYNKGLDTLWVLIDGSFAKEGIHFNINSSGDAILSTSSAWQDCEIDFIVFKNAKDIPDFDWIANGSIKLEKLEVGVRDMLEKVVDPATVDEAILGTTNSKYITPLSLKEVLRVGGGGGSVVNNVFQSSYEVFTFTATSDTTKFTVESLKDVTKEIEPYFQNLELLRGLDYTINRSTGEVLLAFTVKTGEVIDYKLVDTSYDYNDLIHQPSIVNNLTTGGVDSVLSAEQGKVIGTTLGTMSTVPTTSKTVSGAITELNTNVTTHTALVEKHRKITFGTADPTGGVDGDIYFQYT